MKNQIWNFSNTIPAEATGSLTSRKILAYSDALMCVENHMQAGAPGAAHTHPHQQIVYVPCGRFTYTVDGETREIGPGDSVLIPGNVIHSCVCLEDGILLDIFTPMREDFVKEQEEA